MLRLRPIIKQVNSLAIFITGRRVKFISERKFLRCLSINAHSSLIESILDIKKSEEKESQRGKSLTEYLTAVNPDILQLQAKHCVKVVKKRPMHLWLVDDEVAKTFYSLIIDDLLANMTFVIETNPGPGLLTKYLLEAGVEPLYLVDREKYFIEHLKKLNANFNDALKDSIKNFNNWHSTYYFLKSFEDKIPKRKWEEKSALQVIVCAPSARFLNNIIAQLVSASGYMAFGRPIFYCAMYASVFQKYINTEDNHYSWRMSRVFLYNFFNCKVLGTVNRQAFLPWQRKSKFPPGLINMIKDDTEIMYILKIEPKRDLYTKYITQEMLSVFKLFVTHLVYGKDSFLIPKIEQYFPGFGLKLIELNYSLTTRVSDLTGEEFLKIFQLLEKWPDFENTILQYQKKLDLETHFDAEISAA